MVKTKKLGTIPLTVLVIALILAVGGVAFAVTNMAKQDGDNIVDQNPQQIGDDAKQAIVDQKNKEEENPDSGAVTKADITVVDATYYTIQPGAQADAIEVRAFSNNVVTAGTCKITVTSKNGTIYTREVSAEPDGRSSWCGTATIPVDKQLFDSESPWKAKIEFVSPTATGSAEVDVKVM